MWDQKKKKKNKPQTRVVSFVVCNLFIVYLADFPTQQKHIKDWLFEQSLTSGRILLGLFGNRNTRSRRYSCSLGPVLLRVAEWSGEYGLLRLEGITFFLEGFRLKRNGQSCLLLGVDILCIQFFLLLDPGWDHAPRPWLGKANKVLYWLKTINAPM